MAAKDIGTQRVTVEIVILAMIAAFLGLRLYSVLGRRAEHGDEPMQSRFDAASASTSGSPAAVPRPCTIFSTQQPTHNACPMRP